MAFSGMPPQVTGTLEERTDTLIRMFEQEDRNSHGFNDGGDGTTYAEWFADLLTEWMAK